MKKILDTKQHKASSKLQLDWQDQLLDMNADGGSHDDEVKNDRDCDDSRDSKKEGNPKGSRVARRPPHYLAVAGYTGA